MQLFADNRREISHNEPVFIADQIRHKLKLLLLSLKIFSPPFHVQRKSYFSSYEYDSRFLTLTI